MIKPYSDDDYFIVIMINLFSTLKLTTKPLVFGLSTCSLLSHFPI